MRVIQTTAVVTADGYLLVKAPPGIDSGEYKVVVILEETHKAIPPNDRPADDDLPLPVYDLGTWQIGTTLSREEMYTDDSDFR